jgi:hypothetical protein
MVAVTGADALQQLLLARLAGEGDDGLPLSDLLEQQLGDNPQLGPVLAAMRRREEVARQEEAAGPAGEAGPLAADVLARLYAEIEQLRLRNRTAAAALGACPRCWGEEHDCPICRGRGRPGGRAPDPVLYYELVAPAVRRRARQERALAGPPPERGQS